MWRQPQPQARPGGGRRRGRARPALQLSPLSEVLARVRGDDAPRRGVVAQQHPSVVSSSSGDFGTAAPARETLGAAAPVRVAPGVPTAPTQRPSLTVRRSAGDTVLASAAHSKDRSFTSLPLLPTGLSALPEVDALPMSCFVPFD